MTRRGFLQTLVAGLAGAAVFDPLKGLWLPQTETPTTLVTVAAEQAIEAQLALNEMAAIFAREIGAMLNARATALHEVIYRTSKGAVTLTSRERREDAPTLVIEQLGPGQFVPGPRLMKPYPIDGPAPSESQIRQIARNHFGRLEPNAMLVPIGRELRPGVPLQATGPAGIGVDIGLGTDPETGVSARVLKFETTNGRRNQPMLGFEIAAGCWTPQLAFRSDAFSLAMKGLETTDRPDFARDEDDDDVLAEAAED